MSAYGTVPYVWTSGDSERRTGRPATSVGGCTPGGYGSGTTAPPASATLAATASSLPDWIQPASARRPTA